MDKSILADFEHIASPSCRANTSRYAGRLLKHQDLSIKESTLINSSINLSISQSEDGQLINSHADLSMDSHGVFFILFKQFLDARQKFEQLDSVFELIGEYELLCSDYLQVMFSDMQQYVDQSESFAGASQSNHSINPQARLPSSNLPRTLKSVLKRERDTWRLLRILYEDRLRDSCMPEMDEGVLTKRLSDREVISEFYARNQLVRQMQLVVDWLERNEHDKMEEEQYDQRMQAFASSSVYWENTLHALKNSNFNSANLNSGVKNERLLDAGKGNLCIAMDPDAPHREQRNIHSLDAEDEHRLYRHIYRLLRSGRLQEGIKLAEKTGYNWLAAALNGWLLQHDNFDECEDENKSANALNVTLFNEGNPNRDLWKFTCWMVSGHGDDRSIYERAIFGALSGNVADILPLCTYWEDKLWAYFRCSIDVQIEQELKETISPKQLTNRKSGVICTSSRSSVKFPAAYWNNLRDPQEIFREVEAKSEKEELIEEEHCFHQIQKFVILNDLDSALQIMMEWVRSHDTNNMLYPNMVRFFVHLVLFCREVGLLESEMRESLAISILEEYIDYLIDQRQIELIAPYVSCLPRTHQINSYAKLLQFVTDKDQQQLCLNLAKQAGLDIEMITKTVVETIRKSGLDIDLSTESSFDPTVLNQHSVQANFEDKRKIDALNWLFIDEIQYIQLLLQSNSLMRDFVLTGKVDAAKEVFLKLPSDLLIGIRNEWKKFNDTEVESPEITNGVLEHECFKIYFQAHNAIADWMYMFYNNKPQEPKKPDSKKFTDKVAYDHLVKNFDNELKLWESKLAEQAMETAKRIYAILQFQETGEWMRNENQPGASSEDAVNDDAQRRRNTQLANLRRYVIPQLTFSLQMILHSSRQFRQCQELLDLIASEEFRIYQEFSSQQLKELLKNFRETCLEVLNELPDALGFSSN